MPRARRGSGSATCDRAFTLVLQSKIDKSLISKSGAERDRTVDLLNAIQALSQLSYSPNLK